MKFKNFQLIIDGQTPLTNDIIKIKDIGLACCKNYGSDWYTVEKDYIESRYLWLYIEHDNAKIYKDEVLNGENEQNENNPRNKTQLELRQQLFVCFDTTTERLYMNNMDKRGFVQHYFKDTLQKEVLIKNIYATIDEFQQRVKTIRRMKFVQERNLMNLVETTVFQQNTNIYGLDAPNKITMQVDYDNMPVGVLKNTLQRFKKLKDQGQFERIIFVGIDDKEVEHSFDFSSIIKAKEIAVFKKENGLFDKEEVKKIFIDVLRRNDV